MTDRLSDADQFEDFSILYMNDKGRYILPNQDWENFSDAQEIQADQLSGFFDQAVYLEEDVTDVFVWVHGWRNKPKDAIASARKLFYHIQEIYNQNKSNYPHLQKFKPAFIAIHWPSWSCVFEYKKIRDRAKALTDEGEAEFFLAKLLEDLEDKNPYPRSENRETNKVLRGSKGFAIHCIGHSFGGRFLTAAIREADDPRSPLTLSAFSNNGFEFTVDSVLIFQMAAPHCSFGDELNALVNKAPLSGPLVLTHSIYDTANCLSHYLAECEVAIGYCGASEPQADIGQITLKDLNYVYTEQDFSTRIMNVDASWAFTKDGMIQGSHSDFWYPESIHLILSLVNFVNGF